MNTLQTINDYINNMKTLVRVKLHPMGEDKQDHFDVMGGMAAFHHPKLEVGSSKVMGGGIAGYHAGFNNELVGVGNRVNMDMTKYKNQTWIAYRLVNLGLRYYQYVMRKVIKEEEKRFNKMQPGEKFKTVFSEPDMLANCLGIGAQTMDNSVKEWILIDE